MGLNVAPIGAWSGRQAGNIEMPDGRPLSIGFRDHRLQCLHPGLLKLLAFA
jgi:hypothetical protein